MAVATYENEMITREAAREIEEMGLGKSQVRSPMTCDASLGVCRRCYGMDMSTGAMVEEGMAVGIIAAQSIGEPGTQLTMRTFHIGGVATNDVEDSEKKCEYLEQELVEQHQSLDDARAKLLDTQSQTSKTEQQLNELKGLYTSLVEEKNRIHQEAEDAKRAATAKSNAGVWAKTAPPKYDNSNSKYSSNTLYSHRNLGKNKAGLKFN